MGTLFTLFKIGKLWSVQLEEKTLLRRHLPRFLLPLLLPAALAQVDQAINLQVETQKRSAAVQEGIDRLDREGDELVRRYRAELLELLELKRYNEQLSRLIADQEQELAERERQLGELERLKEKIVPFMAEMATALEAIVAHDTPFLAEERRQRVAALEALLVRSDVSVPEKFRRLLEAYQIEARYGHTIEAYQAPLVGEERMVRYLRFGRLGLYYLTLDGRQGGFFDPKEATWHPLEGEMLSELEKAIRIASKQAPPDFVLLPVPAPEAP